MHLLTYMSGPDDGMVRRFAPEECMQGIVFGRVSPCSIVLPYDLSMSRRHARLYWHKNAWWLEDCGSSNGTFIGEFSQAIKVTVPVQLQDGQMFQVGKTRFCLLPSDQFAATTAMAQASAK